jgi:hypothetical protein
MEVPARMMNMPAPNQGAHMKLWTRPLIGIGLSFVIVLVLMHLGQSATSAQPAAAPQDPTAALAQSIVTHVVTLKVEDQRGEPRLITGRVAFDRPVQAYWVSLVGVDMKFQGDTEKYINRELFSVDPFAKVINGKEVEVTGKLGMRDGSGDWDDKYEGTINIAVTAILSR